MKIALNYRAILVGDLTGGCQTDAHHTGAFHLCANAVRVDSFAAIHRNGCIMDGQFTL